MNALETIDRLKEELDDLRPLSPDDDARVDQKLRLEANYHSNAIEGNTLTLGETRSLILHELTARGKPMRDHLDIQGHDSAVKAVEDAVRDDIEMTEVFIRNLHQILLKEPYEMYAETPDGRPTKRKISIGDYKTVPNNVRTSTGETYHFTPPDQVKSAMSDLIDWYRTKESEGEHPIIIAATFHYRFVRIHPFDDGNGRMARLLMNMILIKHGYTVSMIRQEDRGEYIRQLEYVDKTEDLAEFIAFVARSCEYSLGLYLKAARGESIEDPDDIDKEIALFKQSITRPEDAEFDVDGHINEVLYPFYEYCLSKSSLLSDVFGSVQTSVDLIATSMDGMKRSGYKRSPHFPTGRSWRFLTRAAAFKLSIDLITFRDIQDSYVLLEVASEADAHRCRWTFSVGTHDVHLEYEGTDLDELKKRFNELIRRMMKSLEPVRSIYDLPIPARNPPIGYMIDEPNLDRPSLTQDPAP